MADDRNDLAYWLPPIQAAGLPTPATVIIHTDADLSSVLDGVTPDGWDRLITQLRAAGAQVGWPCFLRTGHGSGKHQWRDTCHIPDPDAIAQHVGALVEWSHVVDIMGLPTQTWAMRKLIDTTPLFVCEAFGGFPVTREFRVFVKDGQAEHVQPYWPPDALVDGRPDNPDWRDLLAAASELTGPERDTFTMLAVRAATAVDTGYWSVDLLQDRDGAWWVTDMADGDRSFRWNDQPPSDPVADV